MLDARTILLTKVLAFAWLWLCSQEQIGPYTKHNLQHQSASKTSHLAHSAQCILLCWKGAILDTPGPVSHCTGPSWARQVRGAPDYLSNDRTAAFPLCSNFRTLLTLSQIPPDNMHSGQVKCLILHVALLDEKVRQVREVSQLARYSQHRLCHGVQALLMISNHRGRLLRAAAKAGQSRDECAGSA